MYELLSGLTLEPGGTSCVNCDGIDCRCSDWTRLRLLCRIRTSVPRCDVARGILRYDITPRGKRQ